jgi:hypothetical protein
MNLTQNQQYTKQTRCNNNLILDNKSDFFRPILSNTSVPISNNHEHYNLDKNAIQMYQYDIERSSISTRNNVIDTKKPVQTNFQNNYYTMSFDDLNHQNKNKNKDEINDFYNRNPVNTRRDNIEKTRNTDRESFLKDQGGLLGNFNNIRCENTRENKNVINSSNYIPMPRTLAIPKENI